MEQVDQQLGRLTSKDPKMTNHLLHNLEHKQGGYKARTQQGKGSEHHHKHFELE
jgi:hypothetical protein